MHMSNKKLSTVDMRAKTKIKVCSTPERRIDSPTIDNDSICDSDTASPIHFFCTQDDADVFYNNDYTPKSKAKKSQFKTTPVSRKTKKNVTLQIDKQLPKRKIIKPSQQRNKLLLLQELTDIYQNVHELVKKPSTDFIENPQSEEDMFSDSSDISPRGGISFRKRCLRKNVLSSKFIKSEPECGLESDDSINECLIQVSQAVEKKIMSEKNISKRQCLESFNQKSLKPAPDNDIDQDSMDDTLSNIKLESPHIKKLKHCDSPQYHNDSFESLLGNLNDSTLDRLSQMHVQNTIRTRDFTKVKLEETNDDNMFSNSFVRHNSMPVSPSTNKPSTSGMTFGRYRSMPFNKSSEDIPDDSQARYTADEINRKRQQAREKLLAKGMLRTSKQKPLPSQMESTNNYNTNFQLHVDSTQNNLTAKQNTSTNQKSGLDSDTKLLIEKKRQEALMRLRKRQAQCR